MNNVKRLLLVTSITGLAAMAFLIPTALSQAQDGGGDPSEGEALYQETCAACHGADATGVSGLGLPLADSAFVADTPHTDLIALIVAGRAVDSPDNTTGVAMPPKGGNASLTEAQLQDIVAYLKTLNEGGAPAETAPAQVAATGDAEAGKQLFRGNAGFANGGPPCMACHSVAGLGALGGGQVGPDLTDVGTRLGVEGVQSRVANPAFSPTMQPIFADHALTPDEQADLAAFLTEGPVTERSSSATLQLFLIALGGAIVLLIIAGLVWHRRLKGVRKPMVTKAERGELTRT